MPVPRLASGTSVLLFDPAVGPRDLGSIQATVLRRYEHAVSLRKPDGSQVRLPLYNVRYDREIEAWLAPNHSDYPTRPGDC